MALFLSTHVNKIDRKGRISVPAGFRAVVAGGAFQGVVLFRSHVHACLEGFGMDAMESLGGRLDRFDLFSQDQDDMATAIFGEAVPVPFDGEGRIVLPPEMIAFAGLGEQAAFVGMGRKFQVWEPESFARRREEARTHIQSKGLTLPSAGGETP